LRAILKPESPQLEDGSSTLERLSYLAGFPVKSKAPNYVGARMGRPEKAKERVMTPKVHCLFPTGQFGGMRRDIVEASRKLAVSRVGLAKSPEIIKGTKGLLNKTKTPEPLEKGLLRAGREVSVFKDGTIRFDATNAILTQFRPSEVGLSIEKAHMLGYEKDMEGKPLETPSQLCALEVQDLVVPETCAQYLLKASKFLDDLLSSYYGLEKFYDASRREIGR